MRIRTVFLAIVLLPFLSLLAGGNPILITDPTNEVTPLYLKEETIRASILNDTAIVKTEYVFECFESESTLKYGATGNGIALPFWDPFFNLTVEVDGQTVSYSKGIYLYDPLDGSSRRSLPCVHISVPGEWSPGIVRMNATYECTTTESVEDNRTILGFSYLVGSAQYWNHSIDRASFEFSVQGDGNLSALNGWNKTIGKDMTIFTREYTDWIPPFDLMTLSWEEVETIPMENDITTVKEEGADVTIILIVGAILIILSVSILIYVHRSR